MREQKRQDHERKHQNAARLRELFRPRRKSRPITDRRVPLEERSRDQQDSEAKPNQPQPEMEVGSHDTPEAIPFPQDTGHPLPNTLGPQPNEEGRDTQGTGCSSGEKSGQGACSDHTDYSIFGTVGHQLVKRQVEETLREEVIHKKNTHKVFREWSQIQTLAVRIKQTFEQNFNRFKANMKLSDIRRVARRPVVISKAKELFSEPKTWSWGATIAMNKPRAEAYMRTFGKYEKEMREYIYRYAENNPVSMPGGDPLINLITSPINRGWQKLIDYGKMPSQKEQMAKLLDLVAKDVLLDETKDRLKREAITHVTREMARETIKVIKHEGGKTLIEVGERTTDVPETIIHTEVIKESMVKSGFKKMASGLGMTYAFSGLGTIWRYGRGEYNQELKDKTLPEKAKVVAKKMYDEAPPLLKALTDNAVSIGTSQAMVAGVTYLGYKTEGWKFATLSAVGSIGISIAKGRLFDHLWYQREGMERLKNLKR